MVRRVILANFLAAFCASSEHVSAGLGRQDRKLAVPGTDELRKAERSIRGLFEREYAAKDRPGRRAGARKLIQEAQGAISMAERYVLLRDAGDIAATGIDPGTAIKAIDLLAEQFDVDRTALYAAMIATAKRAILFPEDAAAVAEACLIVWERTMALGDHDAASRWAEAAELLAKNSKDGGLVQAAREMASDAAEAKRVGELAAKAELALSVNPKDPDAYLNLGLHLCLVKWDWAKGLGLLADANDPILRDVARRNLANPSDPEAQVGVGEGWWALAAKERNPFVKRSWESRARHWQDDAFRATTGLVRTRVVKRITKGLVIMKATYGVGSKGNEVKSLVTDAMDKDPWAPVRVGDEFPGATPGADTLTIEYLWNSRRFVETAKEWEVIVLPGIPPNGALIPGASRSFKVVASHFGIAAKLVDVTEAVRRNVTEPYGSFHAGMCGIDPYPGIPKTSVIQFEWHGRRFVRWVREGEVIQLMGLK